MTTQHSDSPREPTDRRSEVLSDATDLGVLLEAILGDPVASVAAQGRSPDEETTRPVAAGARLEPAVAAWSRTGADLEHAFGRGATADGKAAWEFFSEDPQEGNEIAHDGGDVQPGALPSLERPPSPLTWRDRLGVLPSKQSLLVAALAAAALITFGVIGLRERPAETATLPSAEPPALVPSASPVQPSSAIGATDSSEVEVWAAAREPNVRPRVMSTTAPGRRREVPSERPNAPRSPIVVEAPRSAPTVPAVAASPALAERIAEPTNREAAPTRTAIPEGDKPRVSDSEPAVIASGGGVTNGPEPSSIAAAPVPAALPRRIAPLLLTGAQPEYPTALRAAKIGGSVEVRFTIDASGRVINVQSLTGPLQLRAAAEAAVKRWRYEAARVDNRAVETQTSVRFNFDPSPTRRPQQ